MREETITKNDTIEKLGLSTIQHGLLNNRVYLTKLNPNDFPEIIDKIEYLAIINNYSKVFAKVYENLKGKFIECGYNEEGFIPEFYSNKEGAAFLGKYFSEERKQEPNSNTIDNIIQLAKQKSGQASIKALDNYEIRIATEDDANELSELYKVVFKTYPFPVHDPEYLKKTMKSHIDYFIIKDGDKMISCSSAEMDHENKNVEMTDFATLHEYRGKGLALYLLQLMETRVKEKGFHNAYTIARAMSAGMNIVFAKNNYTFAGTLIKNTNICGNLESMNIWYKLLF